MPSKGVNKAIIIGRLGQEPEMRYAQNGTAICTISVATSETWKTQEGEQREDTQWHRIVAFKRMAEVMGEYLHKGSKVYIEGQIVTRKWQDKQGQDRYTTEIKARDFQFLESRDDSQPQPKTQPAPQPESSAPGLDDDLPF